MFTKKTLLKDVYDAYEQYGLGKILVLKQWLSDGTLENTNLEKMSQITHEDSVLTFNFILEKIKSKELNLVEIYSEEEKDESKRNVFAIYLKAKTGAKSAVICPGGGYYNVCSYSEGLPFMRKMYENGINSFCLFYSVYPYAFRPAPLEDLARLISLMNKKKEEFDLDPKDYILMGFSASGHLVGNFASKENGYKKYGVNKPGLLVMSYPVITLGGVSSHLATRRFFLGEKPSEEEVKRYSVENLVDEDYPRTYVWCVDEDNVVPSENAKIMHIALLKHKIPHIYMTYVGTEHGWALAEEYPAKGWVEHLLQFYFGKCDAYVSH